MEHNTLYRFHFKLKTARQWYDIIAECRRLYNSSWSGQRKVKRKLEKLRSSGENAYVDVWFEVPDSKFGTWVSLKTGATLTKEESCSNK